MKKHFNKESVITKKDDKNCEKSTRWWTYDSNYVDDDVKVRNHCHITGKYRGSAHRNCNIKDKSYHKIPIAFHNLENYDSNFTMQELDKFDFQINIIPNGLEKYVSFIINKKLIFIDNDFQLLGSSLHSSVKNLGKDDFKYLSQESDSKVFDLVKQKAFYCCEYVSCFEMFKEELRSKEKSYSSLTCKKIVMKSINMFLKFGI